VTSVLLIDLPDTQAPDLAADLETAGIHSLGAIACDKLVQEALRLAPDALVCWVPQRDEALFEALALLRATKPLPVIAFTHDGAVESLERALDVGVQVWVVQGYAPQRLRPLLRLAQARFRREQGLRAELDALGHRFEERKLIDRAKGILMLTRQVPEEEAFRLLRASAMHAKLRVGQIAQQLIDAVHEAAGVNRAGQLRMLSQRLVKLYALQVAGCEVESARALQAASVERLNARIDELSRLLSKPTFGDLLDGVLAAWKALRRDLEAKPQAAALQQLDARAGALLRAADTLVIALEQAGAAPGLRVINLAGRQRMLSQRLAKEALLAALLDGPAAGLARAAAERTAQEAALALSSLEAAPLSTPELRATLAAVAAAWPGMARGIDDAATPEGRQRLAQASELLLERCERLTAQVEASMQALIG
jgi:AmiR/NasT family two-component response regulator